MFLNRFSDASRWCSLLLGGAGLWACSLTPAIPVIADAPIEALVYSEARQILAAADSGANPADYLFQLAPFPRADVLGLSTGRRRIYVSYTLAQLAAQNSYHRWMLRQTLAHEIAHELAGHSEQNALTANQLPSPTQITAAHLGLPGRVRFQNYSLEKELQADLYGLNYWHRLGWNCSIWVEILNNFLEHGYAGDTWHPTDRRLEQASAHCKARQTN